MCKILFFLLILALWSLPIFAQTRQPSAPQSDFVVMRGAELNALAENLKVGTRRDLVTLGGKQTHFYIQNEANETNLAEVHDAADDYHIVFQGSATYILGGKLVEPKEISAGEWRAKTIEGGRQIELKTGDWLFVPRGLAHQRFTTNQNVRLGLIKIYAKTMPTTREKLIGMWRLKDSFDVRPNGETVRSRGATPRGILVYDASGAMTVQVMDDGRPSFKSPDSAKPEEIKAAVAGYTAYFGKYEINEAEKSVTHNMEGNLFPAEIGDSRTRFFEFKSDQLILTTPPFASEGEQRTRKIIWERIK